MYMNWQQCRQYEDAIAHNDFPLLSGHWLLSLERMQGVAQQRRAVVGAS